jgi:hypothetical protein
MTSAPVRDQLSDHLLTPQNAALVLIDYQPSQVAAVRSMDRDLLLRNAVSTVRTVKAFSVRSSTRPSTSAPAGGSRPCPSSPACWPTTSRWTGPQSTPGKISSLLRPSTRRPAASSSSAPCGRKSVWPSPPSTRSAKGTRSTRSSTRSAAPRRRLTAGLDRVIQAGAQPISWVSLGCELQSDWARLDAAPAIVEIVLTDRLLKE